MAIPLIKSLRVVHVDSTIGTAAFELMHKYRNRALQVEDALIAATAWIKRMPLFTRNRKHYAFIAEIELGDLPSE